MNQAATRVLRHLTGEKSLETVSSEQLQQLVEQHPYFPIGQFLFSKKLKAENDEAFIKQAQRTALYFTNTLWLDYQLTKEKYKEVVFDEEEVKVHTEELAQAIDVPAEEITAASELAHQTLAEPELAVTELTEAATTGNVETDALIENISDTQEEPAEQHQVIETVSQQQLIEQPKNFIHTDVVTETDEEMAGASTTVDEATEAFLNEVSVSSADATETVRLSDNSITHAEPAVEKRPIVEHVAEPKGIIQSQPEEADVHEKMYQSIKAMLDATSEEAAAGVENGEIPIDPYFTIDYFASQGIKLDFDPNPQDKLGQHLKKFTQWLKHMKKLGPEDAQHEVIDAESEADIQEIANTSNTAKEVVTEAMASVLEKQGKKAKAIELYNKLSFLNPDKSAYFADKIKNLKGF